MVLTSIYGTVYNNARTVNMTLCTLLDALPDFEDHYELVITDSFSSDGTWEILQRWSKAFKNIRLLRVKSTRGKGRDIALQHAEGDYVLYIDFDVVFEKEFGRFIDKLRRLCVNRELYYPYGFSTKETSITIGGWRDLNYGEDWEFIARAIANGVKVQHVLTIPFNVNERVDRGFRETRYVRSRISHGLRKIRNYIDAVRGCNLHPEHFVQHILPDLHELKVSSLLFILVYPFAAIHRFEYVKGVTNWNYVLANEEIMLPEQIGFPPEYFLFLCHNLDGICERLERRILNLKRLKDVKMLLLDKTLVLYRNYAIVEKYIETWL